ncbi:hypothetical protein GQ457_14G012520 [Hibiscus cannabinus]
MDHFLSDCSYSLFIARTPVQTPAHPSTSTQIPAKTRRYLFELKFRFKYDLIEGSVDRRDRPCAQPNSSRSTQPRESVITEDSCKFSPDQTGNPLRPKASPWTWWIRIGWV